MVNGIRISDPRGFNNGRSSKFRVGSRVRQTPEEGRRRYWPKCCGNSNKDEDNSPKTLNDKKGDTCSPNTMDNDRNLSENASKDDDCISRNILNDDTSSLQNFKQQKLLMFLPKFICVCMYLPNLFIRAG